MANLVHRKMSDNSFSFGFNEVAARMCKCVPECELMLNQPIILRPILACPSAMCHIFVFISPSPNNDRAFDPHILIRTRHRTQHIASKHERMASPLDSNRALCFRAFVCQPKKYNSKIHSISQRRLYASSRKNVWQYCLFYGQ